jgi:hypothetical protein
MSCYPQDVTSDANGKHPWCKVLLFESPLLMRDGLLEIIQQFI